MVVDFAVHSPDKEDGGISNPHFHVMCPIRPIEPDGKWATNSGGNMCWTSMGERVLDEAGQLCVQRRSYNGLGQTRNAGSMAAGMG